jgi:hypothetical protein
VKDFICNEGIVSYKSSWDKGTLVGTDDIGQNSFESIGNSFGDDF